MASAFMASLHHLLFFVVAVALGAQLALLAGPVTETRARKLGIFDAHLGAAALGIVAVGFLRAVYFEKGWAFYAGNPWFHAKIGAFVLVWLLSIFPTVQFIKWRRGAAPAAGTIARVRRFVIFELGGLAAVFVFAALMARGA